MTTLYAVPKIAKIVASLACTLAILMMPVVAGAGTTETFTTSSEAYGGGGDGSNEAIITFSNVTSTNGGILTLYAFDVDNPSSSEDDVVHISFDDGATWTQLRWDYYQIATTSYNWTTTSPLYVDKPGTDFTYGAKIYPSTAPSGGSCSADKAACLYGANRTYTKAVFTISDFSANFTVGGDIKIRVTALNPSMGFYVSEGSTLDFFSNNLPTSQDFQVSGTPSYVFTLANFAFQDTDTSTDSDQLEWVKVTALPTTGSLEYYTDSGWTGVFLGQEISRADIIAGKLRSTGVQTFQFKVSDGYQFSANSYTATFTTDTVAPTLSSSSPSDDATSVGVADNIVLTFNENIAAGTGNIVISDGASDTRTIPVGDAQVSISGATLTINPTANLAYSTVYNVRIDATAIEDVAGNAYAGIADATTLNFTTTPRSTKWADWSVPSSFPFTNTAASSYSYASGTTGTVLDPRNGNSVVNITVTGEISHTSSNNATWVNGENPAESFDTTLLSSPNGEDRLDQTGYTLQEYKHHTIAFNSPVDGVVMGIWSLGGGQVSSLLFSEDFEIVDTETSGLTKVITPEGYELVGTANSTGGAAGLIQFYGSNISQITYTVTRPEIYSGVSVALTTNTLTGSGGATKTIDVTRPTLTSSNPADDATGVAVASDITLTFNENIVDNGGNVKLYKADGTLFETFTSFSISGATVTLNPSSDLDPETGYYIQISSDAFADATGNAYVGIADATTLNFVTDGITAGTAVNGSSDLTLTLPGSMQGNVTAYQLLADTGTTPAVSGTISGNVRVTLSVDAGTLAITTKTNLTAPTGYTTTQWDGATEVSFVGSLTDVNAALATLQHKGPGATISGSVSSADAFYLASTGSYYQFVSFGGSFKTWTESLADARTKTLNGLTGYLAHVTTQEEKDFLVAKAGLGTPAWLGGYASNSQNDWVWSTEASSPDSGETFWSGLGSGTAQNSFYDGFCTGEPNNGFQGEPYLQISHLSGGCYNDLANNNSSGSYSPQGYFVEFTPNLSATNTAAAQTTVLGDTVAPTVTGPSGSAGDTTAAISVDENQTAVTTLTADESVTWSLTGSDDDAKFAIDANTGVITFVTAPDYETPTDVGDTANNNTYVMTITATDAANNTSTQTLTVTVLDLWDTLPGTVNGSDGDVDGDGIADSLESTTADRDGDGIVDASDYDPQGYLYCEDDGRILAGGSISVTGPAGSNSSVGTANNIRIVKDGSDGEYQWFATAPGTYTMAVTYPTSVGVPSTTRMSSGTLDVTSLLPSNPASIGSSEFGTTGSLANYLAGYSLSSPAANTTTAFYTTFDIEAGDPHVLGNNIPVAQCGENNVTVAGTTNGAEANGATPSQAVFTINQGRISTQATTVSYSVSGTATSGTDFIALSGSATIPAGDTSVTVPISILEDTFVEGDETIVVTLTSITSGDLTTQLSATGSQLTASRVITDDDFATVVVSNDDLITTEGRSDDNATMSFSLGGQPTSDVVLTFTGDAQCTVSPSTMTFTASDFATQQALSIAAINDEDVEGAHSCQATVTVTSADTNFNNFALTLASVTVADDLVDQVRTPVTNILQGDFEQTVATQSRQFAQISKSALNRLQNDEDMQCGDGEAFDVDGAADVSGSSFATAGTFDEDFYDCVTKTRRITQGSFALTKSDTIDTQAMLTFTLQKEKEASEGVLNGSFFGGYISRASLDGVATGEIDGIGAHGGLYGAREVQSGLFFDYYAAASIGRHVFDMSIYAPAAPIQVNGDYAYGAVFVGAALSGEAIYDSVTLRPRVGIDLSYADAGDADISASQLGFTDTGRIGLSSIDGTRIFAEPILVFGNRAGQEVSNASGIQRLLELAPRLYCEKGFGQQSHECGFGGYVSFNNYDPNKSSEIAVTFDYENNNEQSERLGLELSYSRDIFDGSGAVATRFGSDHLGNAKISQSLDFEF